MSATTSAIMKSTPRRSNVTVAMIASEFRKHVADIVVEVTDSKSLPKAELSANRLSRLVTRAAKQN